MKNYFFPALRITAFTIVLFGILYPLFIVVLSGWIAPNSGKGEVITMNDKVVGFELIGQSFTSAKYFNSRPSAVGYNAAATGGSNKGATNVDYLKQVEERIADFISKNPDVKKQDIPVDLITASGGGLDPHISVKAAQIQIPRIAKERGLPEKQIIELVNLHSHKPLAGIFGTSTVHVLKLNIALDNLQSK
jgi:potassium-transporting ATPase KdpC subunit